MNGGEDSKKGLDKPTEEISPRWTWIRSVSNAPVYRTGFGRRYKVETYKDRHSRLQGREVGHIGSY